MKSDATLLREARSHPGAFRELYERYADGVHGFHLRRTRDTDVAHDLTAETFAQAWLSRARFRDEAAGSAGPWLFAIARHVLLASVRRETLERTACERLGVFERLDRVPAQAEPRRRLIHRAPSRWSFHSRRADRPMPPPASWPNGCGCRSASPS